MELASDRALSLVVKDEGTVVAALLSTAVAAPVPDMTVMELRLVAVQPDNDDAAEVRCPPPPPPSTPTWAIPVARAANLLTMDVDCNPGDVEL